MHPLARAIVLSGLLMLAGPPAAAAAPHRADTVIFELRPGVGTAARDAVLQGAPVVGGIAGTRVRLARVAGDPAAVSARLNRHPLVVYAEVNRVLRTQATPDDARFPELWGLNNANDADIDAPEGWDAPALGGFPSTGGAKIGIVDTGITPTHQDLVGKTVNCAYAAGFFGLISTIREGSCSDGHGHGTHVAGTAAATANNVVGVAGVSFNSPLAICRALNAAGFGYTLDIANCIRYLADRSSKVISMSLGGPGTTTLHNQIKYAASKDALLVAAAGNDGTTIVRYPAGYPEVVSVAATDRNDVRASFSNMNPDVEVAAPGVGILSTWRDGGYFTASGTSMATPHAAGVAAVVRTLAPGLTAGQARERLTSTVDDLGALGRDTTYGFGRVNLGNAVAGLP
jgi:thermitase